ncbi:thiolase [Hesseltinella vesiculosa]|uniref:acetyl-CoA C-acyltransferase n=1 Tax=Hesseltinella vesiculosa TaxID=101127 RepID=A0A1X2GLJ1_9FUNG|nr:thiolase [Hesseltinella vesiculosa]
MSSVSLPYPIRLPALEKEQVTNAIAKSPEDIVVIDACRTALAKGRKGGFKDTNADEMLSGVLKGLVKRTGIDPALVQDIAVGNVTARGGLATPARMAALHAGFPITTSVSTCNRQCSSGLQACVQIASAIQAGLIDIGIGAGVESMSTDYYSRKVEVSERLCKESQAAADCKIPMGLTSENVAEEYGLTREEQDAFSVESHRRAAAAQAAGYFDGEIVPLTVTVLDKDGENPKQIVVDKDEGIRANSTVEGLAKLKAVFKPTGSTTAGNASQITDGAAAVLFMKRKTAQKLGLPIIGRYITACSVGVPPRVMGIGPAYAIPVAVERAGLKLEDIDVYEINEAFASQALYTVRVLDLDPKKVNINGGGISLGHPLGATGARQLATLQGIFKNKGGRYGVTSMCIGSGMGMAAVWENELA